MSLIINGKDLPEEFGLYSMELEIKTYIASRVWLRSRNKPFMTLARLELSKAPNSHFLVYGLHYSYPDNAYRISRGAGPDGFTRLDAYVIGLFSRFFPDMLTQNSYKLSQ